MSITLNQHHKGLLNFCAGTKTICQPLFDNSIISAFGHVTVSANSGLRYLSSDSDWLEHYFTAAYHPADTLTENPEFIHNKFTLIHEIYDNPVVSDARDNFGWKYGVAVIEKTADGLEIFRFCTKEREAGTASWFLNNLQLLENFSNYFREQSADMLKAANKHQLYPQIQADNQILENLALETDKPENKVLAKLHPHRIYISETESVQLTNREFDCAAYLISGYTAKAIAQQEQLSPRTVEFYIANLKQKLDCHYKSDLIQKLRDCNLATALKERAQLALLPLVEYADLVELMLI